MLLASIHCPYGNASLLSSSWCDNRWSPTRHHASEQAELQQLAVVLEAGGLMASYAQGSHGDVVAIKNPAIADGAVLLMYRIR